MVLASGPVAAHRLPASELPTGPRHGGHEDKGPRLACVFVMSFAQASRRGPTRREEMIMTRNKARKTAARHRMAQTGEPYSVARKATQARAESPVVHETPEVQPVVRETPEERYVREAGEAEMRADEAEMRADEAGWADDARDLVAEEDTGDGYWDDAWPTMANLPGPPHPPGPPPLPRPPRPAWPPRFP